LDSDFSPFLTAWYHKNKRDLPWRKHNNPYIIWLSEIILQQTRVAQGLPYFLAFLDRFPTVCDMAKATENDILKLWQGLGYYSRARNMHTTAQIVCQDRQGIFPSSYKELIKLKGIGPYSASAIASFSSGEPVAVVDGNVHRVLSRVFGIYTPINSTEGKKRFQELAESLLPPKDSATHNQAIMEFGALHCTPKNPKCYTCIFQHQCYAHKHQAQTELPVKIKKNKIKKRYICYLIYENNTHIVIHLRNQKGIWRNLYDFPMIEFEEKPTESMIHEQIRSTYTETTTIQKIHELQKPHKLSHQHLYIQYYKISLPNSKLIQQANYIEVLKTEIENYPVPVVISDFIKTFVL